jgi:ketosteroid isomerase-like protein
MKHNYRFDFMRFPFDQRQVPGIPWTRMPGTANAPASTLRYGRSHAAWALAAAFALMVSAIPVCAAMGLAQKHESRHEIDSLEDEWRNAILTSDTKAMDSLLADDYMAITPSGTIQSREDTLEGLRTGRIHFTSLTITDRRVRFYGTTAVVTSLADIQANTPDGPVSGSYRYTRVYVKDPQGTWKVVSFEASHVREPGPHKRNELH